MAYVRGFNPNEDLDQVNKGQTTDLKNPTIVSAGSGPVTLGSGLSAKNNPNAQVASQEGGFANLQRYLDANKGGAEQLGNRVAGAITGATEQAKQGIAGAGTEFGKEVEKGTLKYNPNLVGAAASDASNYLYNPELQKQLSGQYGGPNTYTGSAEDIAAQKAINEAQQKAAFAGDVGGRTQLLKETLGTPGTKTTTAGQNLNQFLLQNTQPAFNKVKSAAEQAKPLTEQYGQKVGGLQQQVEQAKQASAATKQQALERLGQGFSELQSNITQTAAQKQEEANQAADLNRYKEALNDPNNPLVAKLGLNAQTLADFQAKNRELAAAGEPTIDITQYLSPGQAAKIGTLDVTSQKQLADLTALGQLTGLNTLGFLNQGYGGFDPTLNYGGAYGDVQSNWQAYQQRMQQAEQYRKYLEELERLKNQAQQPTTPTTPTAPTGAGNPYYPQDTDVPKPPGYSGGGGGGGMIGGGGLGGIGSTGNTSNLQGDEWYQDSNGNWYDQEGVWQGGPGDIGIDPSGSWWGQQAAGLAGQVIGGIPGGLAGKALYDWVVNKINEQKTEAAFEQDRQRLEREYLRQEQEREQRDRELQAEAEQAARDAGLMGEPGIGDMGPGQDYDYSDWNNTDQGLTPIGDSGLGGDIGNIPDLGDLGGGFGGGYDYGNDFSSDYGDWSDFGGGDWGGGFDWGGGGDWGGGDSFGGCPQVDSFVPGDRRVGDTKVGDELTIACPITLNAKEEPVTFSDTKKQPGYRFETENGVSLVASSTAPIPTKAGKYQNPQNLLGEVIATQIDGEHDWSKVIKVESVGDIDVQRITVGNENFWVGEKPGKFVLHHNVYFAVKKDGGEVVDPSRYINGGRVSGPGTSRSDSINAKLSDGEYVIPADAVSQVGPQYFDQLVQYLRKK